jgi:DNA-binding transcriptional LysR family regulator
MNLRQLEHLVAVAEAGSLAAAARRVHLSQPALTRSIQALESRVGLPLCDRGARGIKLTTTGQLVVDRARRILFESSCLDRDLLLLQQHEIGQVCFGLGPLVASIVLADAMCALQVDWPKLQIRAEVQDGLALLDAVRAEQLDFAIIEHRFIPSATELEVRPLIVDEVACLVRPEHPLAGRDLALGQLRQATLASVPAPTEILMQFGRLFRLRPGEHFEFQVESNDFRALVAMACRADIVLFAPMRAVLPEVTAGRLSALRLPGDLHLHARFDLVYLAQRTLSPAAECAIAAVEAAAK